MDTWAPAQDVGEFSQAVASRRQAEAQAKQADRRRQEEDRRREQERNAENERSREQNRNEQTTRDSQRREQAQEQDRRQQAARRYIATYYPRYGGIYSTARAAADEAARLNRIQEAQVDAASEAVMNSTRRGEATVVTSGIRAGRWRYTYDRNLDGFVVYHE
jgi:flagellar biosynthesis GTPase FlhF